MRAGEAVRARADQALLTSIHRPARGVTPGGASPGGAADDDATLAACRLVAEACGIREVTAPRGADRESRLSPVERIALASRFRVRAVRLAEGWWRQDAGPLLGHRRAGGAAVALLWRRGRYEAHDPVNGRRTRVTAGNADQFEPQAVMFYRPLPERPLSLRRLMLFSLRGTRRDLRSLAASGLLSVLLGTLVPIATGQILGVYVPRGQRDLIVLLSLALVGTTVVSAAFALWENTALLRVEGRVEATLQPAVWDRLLRLPVRFFARRSTGELATAAMGISAIRSVLSGISSVAVQSGTVAVVNLVLLLVYSVPLALVALGLLAVVGAAFLGLGLWQLRWQRKLTALTNSLNNRAFQTLRGLPKLRVAAAENFAYAAWAGDFARSRELQRTVGRIRNLTTVLGAVYLPLCTLLMYALLAGPARGTLSASAFLTFNSAVTAVLTSVTQLTGALLSAAAAQPLFEQMRPVFQELPEVREDNPAPGALSGEIEVEHLSFRYAEDAPLVLDDVSFRVRPGEFVAVVGASGCGKSTLLRLLIGFEKPTGGSVRYDGQDLAALDLAAVRRQFGVVLQHAQPFQGSILECVSGNEQFTPEEIAGALEMAGLTQDVARMPMGVHTVLSDGGGTVSGGQRQRLMIAQALIRRPRVLFFDEATSALDNETQRIVIDSTRKLNATRVVIAHRLSTVLDADRVIVLADGRVAQQGSPAELLADPTGLFHHLVRRQMR
jgi:ATP-binding cassette subfamily C protein